VTRGALWAGTLAAVVLAAVPAAASDVRVSVSPRTGGAHTTFVASFVAPATGHYEPQVFGPPGGRCDMAYIPGGHLFRRGHVAHVTIPREIGGNCTGTYRVYADDLGPSASRPGGNAIDAEPASYRVR
jgi:hypothetical protein